MSIVFIIISLLIPLSFGDCPNNCNGRGLCQNNACECIACWGGDDCTLSCEDMCPGIGTAIYVYQGVTLFLMLVALCSSSYTLYRHLKGSLYKWNVITWGILLIEIGIIIRITYFAVDPHRLRYLFPDIWGSVIDSIWYNTSQLLWFYAVYAVVLWWLELMIKTGSLSRLRNLHKLRPYFIIFCIFTFLLTIFFGAGSSINLTPNDTFYAFEGLIIVIMGVLSITVGIKLQRELKKHEVDPSLGTFDPFLKMVKYFLLWFNIGCLIFGISVLVYIGISARSSPWVWLSFECLFRFEEAILVSVGVHLLKRKGDSGVRNPTECSASIEFQDITPKDEPNNVNYSFM